MTLALTLSLVPTPTVPPPHRERVLTAEGEKKAYTLQSEGVKIQLINESEGKLIQVQNAAKAHKEKLRLEAEVSCGGRREGGREGQGWGCTWLSCAEREGGTGVCVCAWLSCAAVVVLP